MITKEKEDLMKATYSPECIQKTLRSIKNGYLNVSNIFIVNCKIQDELVNTLENSN